MKRTETITTPARESVTKTVEVTVCDLCSADHLVYRCMEWVRDACNNCSIPNPSSMSDYPERLCSLCRKLHKKYMPLIADTEDVQEAAEDKIRAAWKAESLQGDD